MSPKDFREHVADLAAQLAGRPLNTELADWLNAQHGVGTTTYELLRTACDIGVAEGWLCDREGGGIRYGRIFKPADDLFGFSVDVVDMNNLAGPHHTHPTGEIDLIMPIDSDAEFDGHRAGWLVYPPGSSHSPTVSNGRALVLYLLPEGRIEFTR
ncbi:DUF4863 family protein [Cupriavidus pauculus]|uniref:4-hydroxylaminobenzoate lyase n=1 Tax=Cupriavidus pauculus TaxID=82633 RepID=UPI001FD129C4|nr:DUF4863 family protein [Cupriavidus pauculus]